MRVDIRVLHQLLHTREVDVRVRTGLWHVENLADSGEELAQALDLLLGVLNVAQKLLDALVHDMLREHLQFEQLTNELDKTQTLPFHLLRGITLLQVKGGLTSVILLGGSC